MSPSPVGSWRTTAGSHNPLAVALLVLGRHQWAVGLRWENQGLVGPGAPSLSQVFLSPNTF